MWQASNVSKNFSEPVTSFEDDELNEATQKSFTNKDSFVLLNSTKEKSDNLKLNFLIELVLAIENENFKTAESLLKKVSFYKRLNILINYNEQNK